VKNHHKPSLAVVWLEWAPKQPNVANQVSTRTKPNSATTNHYLLRHVGHRPSVSAGQLLCQHCRDSAGHSYMPTTTSRLCRVAVPAAVAEELSITKPKNIFNNNNSLVTTWIADCIVTAKKFLWTQAFNWWFKWTYCFLQFCEYNISVWGRSVFEWVDPDPI